MPKKSVKKDYKYELLTAISSSDELKVRKLLQQQPSLIDAKYGNNETGTILHVAACCGKTKIAEILLEKKPTLADAVDNEGYTALHASICAAAADNDGLTALPHAALCAARISVAIMLIEKKPELCEIKANSGDTPLHFAALFGHTKVVKKLLEIKPYLANIKDNLGDTPLHKAFYNFYNNDKAYNSVDVIKILIPNMSITGLTSPNISAIPVIAFIVRSQDEEIVNLLKINIDTASEAPQNLKKELLEGKKDYSSEQEKAAQPQVPSTNNVNEPEKDSLHTSIATSKSGVEENVGVQEIEALSLNLEATDAEDVEPANLAGEL